MSDVCKTLRKVNVWEAAGLPGLVLREYANQLAHVLTDIFSTSLEEAIVTSCFISATIIPVPVNQYVLTTTTLLH